MLSEFDWLMRSVSTLYNLADRVSFKTFICCRGVITRGQPGSQTVMKSGSERVKMCCVDVVPPGRGMWRRGDLLRDWLLIWHTYTWHTWPRWVPSCWLTYDRSAAHETENRATAGRTKQRGMKTLKIIQNDMTCRYIVRCDSTLHGRLCLRNL